MPETPFDLFPICWELLPSGVDCLFYVSHHPVYEEDDELLWSPGVIPESKVQSFLLDVLSRTTDEKLGCDRPANHVRDNEQVCNDFIPSFAVFYTA